LFTEKYSFAQLSAFASAVVLKRLNVQERGHFKTFFLKTNPLSPLVSIMLPFAANCTYHQKTMIRRMA